MNLKSHSLLFVVTFFLLGNLEIANAKKEDAGAIIGAIIGGVVGNNVGKGNGKAIATGLGIIVGAVIGAEIGNDLDEADRRAMQDAQRRAFQRPYGEKVSWDGAQYGSRSRSRGEFRTIREGRYRNSQLICREYESIITTRRQTVVKKGIACSQRDGRWVESRTEDVIFENYNDYEDHRPSGPIVPEDNYDRNSSLKGYCPDYNHENFYAAKEFAQDSSYGPGIIYSQAASWANDYNRTHRCNTIQEYKERFKALYTFASDSSQGLGLFFREARQYATNNADRMTLRQISQNATSFRSLYGFATDSSSGLGLFFRDARRIGTSWIENQCEGPSTIERMKVIFAREYEFATSSRGLGMFYREARKYALGKLRNQTRCYHLLETN